MKKKIIIAVIAAAALMAAILGIINGRKPEREILSGAKLVFGENRKMREAEQTDIVTQKSECENEIFWESREDDTIGH